MNISPDSRDLKPYMQLSDFNKEPIIIGGCGRSGTTLLLAILGSHPRIFAIEEETSVFCPTGYAKSPDLHVPIDITQIERYLSKSIVPPTCTRWCEKTPKNVLFFGSILEAFQNKVQIIHIVRDGRDVITSIHPQRAGILHVSASRWTSEVMQGLEFFEHPKVLTIRYEDLVLDFNVTIRRICDFLGEEFVEELSEWHAKTNIRWQSSWQNGAVQPLYDTSIHRWNRPEYEEVIRNLESDIEARKCLERLGYARVASAR